ncbi:uncharacterized protein LOC110988994 isoform X2 [Acanthaster planci]|nr:uncharacterized protein LOC110988994 isoform X2 [Acanthaster planci]XP_022108725.1 uncharacterized protein LOC110988994 isoform X2 [Acanthaster planci]XP_022108726.1 uncharacterized protein LOC110988994 isoform X2 [Acanthaster planci]
MMHATAITCLICLFPVCASSIPVDEDYSSSSSDYQSSADYLPLLPAEVFALNDKNGNGFITQKEYRKANPGMTDIKSKLIFDNFDWDKDGRISLSEFTSRVQHDDPKPQGNCIASIMRTCSSEFIDAVRKWGNKQGDVMCHCLPIYRDCIRSERATCTMVSQKDREEEEVLNEQVDGLLRRFKRALCQDMSPRVRPSVTAFISNTPASSRSVSEPRGVRQVRSIKREFKRFKSRSRRQNCIVSTMKPCNNVFIAALQAQGEDPCHSLVKYRHCVHKSTRRCSDPNLSHIQRAVKFLAKQHRRVKICAKYGK